MSKLKFHTKPHNNHDTFNKMFIPTLVLVQVHAYERGPRGEKVVSHSVCDYCEVLCEILIFGYHISLISYFLDGVHGLEHNNFF